jgi:hypothetical protein
MRRRTRRPPQPQDDAATDRVGRMRVEIAVGPNADAPDHLAQQAHGYTPDPANVDDAEAVALPAPTPPRAAPEG